jgi:hypothetical protein
MADLHLHSLQTAVILTKVRMKFYVKNYRPGHQADLHGAAEWLDDAPARLRRPPVALGGLAQPEYGAPIAFCSALQD